MSSAKRPPKLSIAADSAVLAAVDRCMRARGTTNRSRIAAEALRLWLAIRDAAAQRLFRPR